MERETAMLKSILIAFSMFSAIPVPQVEWDEKGLRYSLCAFPLVGAVIALVTWAWTRFCSLFSCPEIIKGAGLCLLPVLLTGGIHLDGFADTWDALSSHGDVEKMQEILKDPHLGAFAGIRLCVYFIAAFALWTALPELKLSVLLGIFGLSRCLSGIALVTFPIRPGSGLARTFSEAAETDSVRRILYVMALIFAGLLTSGGGILSCAAAVMVFLRYRRMCKRIFGGLSGDLAGWFVQTAELWMLGILVLCRYVGGLL